MALIAAPKSALTSIEAMAATSGRGSVPLLVGGPRLTTRAIIPSTGLTPRWLCSLVASLRNESSQRTISRSSFDALAASPRRPLAVQSSAATCGCLLVAAAAAIGSPTRCFAAAAANLSAQEMLAKTPLGTEAGAALLKGLQVYAVPATSDAHPLAVYGIHSETVTEDRPPILLLHGRTWSSVPVYHLLGGDAPEHSRSLMEALYDQGLQPYAMDFRGFGGTPVDAAAVVEPNRCVSDTDTVLRWIAQRHGLLHPRDQSCLTSDRTQDKPRLLPTLLGWSQGALVAQLVAQKSPHIVGKLILYGSIYSPRVSYPRLPIYSATTNGSNGNSTNPVVYNTFDAAIEDFTVEDSIPPEPARLFAEAALVSDPIKAKWTRLHQFNNCDPARLNVETLVVAGDQDPYAPVQEQSELFANLGRGADRTWSILANADHAVHLLDGRSKFVEIVKNFVR